MADLNDITIGLKLDDADVVRGLKTFERMKRQIGDITLAERKGEITKKQYNRALQQMGQQLGKVTNDINGAKSAIQKYAYAIKDATDEQIKMQVASGKGMRKFEMIAQQAGYQFGDLAVQIQSGTNAAVALGQQGSQLLGFFGPYGALAGAALAISTAFIAPLIKAKEKVKDLEKATTEAIKNIEEKLRTSKLGVSEEELGFIDKLAKAQQDYDVALKSYNEQRAAFIENETMSEADIEDLLRTEKDAMDAARS